MPVFSFFGLHQRGEAAQGTSPRLQHRRPRLDVSPKPCTPVRERIKTGLKDYDSSLSKFIIRKLDESSRRERPGPDEMPPAENATPESRLSVDQAGDNSLLQPEMYHPMIDSQVPSSVSSMGKNRREDSWDTDTTEVSFSGRHIDLKPWSETQRFSGSLPTSVSPMPSNRLSRSFKGIDRLKKRHSHGSTIRSSFTPSLWSNRLSTSSSASTLSLGGVGHGELAMATVAPSQESRDSKRPKLSPSSSQVNLDGLNVANSQRQSSEVSLSNCGDSGFFWETISPSPYDGRPEIRILQNGPESVESRMKDLAIDDADPQNPGKALSIISEASSAGHAAQDIQALPDRQGPHLVPRSPNIHHDSKSFSSHTSDNGSYIRSPAAPVTLTPCTSVDYGDGDDDVDPDEDSLSDVSGETEESFIEAFNATSLHPDVLPQVLAMRRQIMSLVEAGIMEWMRSCTSGTPSQQPSGSPSSGTSGGSDASKNQGGRGVKRNFSGDQSNDNGLGGSGDGGRDGDGNGDDDGDGDGDGGPKRRKGASPPEEQTIKGPPLACPFVKRYPGQVWPTVCQTGFLTVSRLKEHIYRKHTHPPHCKRCFEEFKTEAELVAHAQQDVSCNRTSPPASMIGRISDETRKQVKCRRGIQKQSEHSKWNGVYQILFPGEAVPDRPYADFGPPDTQRSLEELVRFRQQSGRMIKEKLRQILLPDEMTELILQSVEEVFDSLRPDSTARTVAHNTVHGEDEPAPHLDRPQDQPTVFSGTQFTDTPAYGDPQDQILLMGGESIEDSPAWLEEYNGSFQQSLFESDLGNNGAFGLWHNEPEYGGSN